MKIEHQRTSFEPVGAGGTVDRPGSAPRAGSTADGPGADTLSFSDALQLAQRANAAAAHAPAVRPDAVTQAKALADSGTLGQDLDKLADALIDASLSGNGD